MEGRGAGAGEGLPLSNQLSPYIPGHLRKRQRSNPGPDTSPYDDVFGGSSWRCSPVSDPDIDYNVQSSKRYLSEVMANNLTRHMSLRPSTSMGTAPPPPPPAGLPPGSPGDDMIGHALPQHPLPPFTHPHAHPHGPSYTHAYGVPGLLTPPGGCSPQRTCASEMSEGLIDPGGEILQPMNTSDASISVSVSQGGGGGGKASAALAAESATSETADSELLDERERSVSLTGLLWGPGSGALGPAGAAAAAGQGFGAGGSGAAAGQGFGAGGSGVAFGAGRTTMLPAGMAGLAAGSHCAAVGPGIGSGSGGFAVASAGSPFSSQGVFSRRLSEVSQGATTPAGPACASSQQHQPQQQHQMLHNQQQLLLQQHVLRGPSPRGYTAGGRGLLVDIPTSPSDTRFGGLDLRKTALLRSISRRAEETTSDGGGAATAAAVNTPVTSVIGFHPGAAAAATAACGGGGMADSLGPECAVSVSAATDIATAAATVGMAVPTRVSPPAVRYGGGGLRSAVSWSGSGLSEGMSEGGASGGPTGMELSSNSGEGGGGGCGRGSSGDRGVVGAPLEESLDGELQQQHQQQQQQLLLMQQLMMQQQQHEESCVVVVAGQQPQQTQQQLQSPCLHPALHLQGTTGLGGGTLAAAHSCSLGSPPAGVATPPTLPPVQLVLLHHDHDSMTPPPPLF